MELSNCHTCCKTPDYKYWMPTFVQEITVLQKMDWSSLHLLPLAKFYNRVCSAVMFTSLNSTINRSQAVICLNDFCTLVFERHSSCLGSYGYFKSAFFGLQYSGCFHLQYLAYSEHLYMKAPAGYDNDWGTASLCKSSYQLVKFPVNVIFFVVKSLALISCLASDQCLWFLTQIMIKFCSSLAISLNMDFSLMPVRRTSQVISRTNFVHYWQFSQHGFLAARLQIVLSSCVCDDLCNACRQ